MPSSENRTSVRERIFQIIEIGAPGDYASRAYDVVNMLSIVINLIVSIMYTFDELCAAYGPLLLSIEAITVAFLHSIFSCTPSPRLSASQGLLNCVR